MALPHRYLRVGDERGVFEETGNLLERTYDERFQEIFRAAGPAVD